MTNYDFIKPTPRKKISGKERATIFLREDGICHLCEMRIIPGQEWDVSHPDKSLWAGGTDDRHELKPAHKKCHRAHTDVETTQRAREVRKRNSYLGAKKSTTPLLGSKRHHSGIRKRMDGTIEKWGKQ